MLTPKVQKQSKWATGWWRQFASCYGRELLSITRNPADVAGRTMTFAWVAILMGLLYYGMPSDATSIRGRLNMTFNILSFFCLMPYVSMSLYSADKKFYIAGEGVTQGGGFRAGCLQGLGPGVWRFGGLRSLHAEQIVLDWGG